MDNTKIKLFACAAAAAIAFSLTAGASAAVYAGSDLSGAAEQSKINGDSVSTPDATSDGALDASDFFTNRDLTQEADLDGAEKITLTDGQDITITEEGVYVLSGSASDVTVVVEAGDEDKVQIVLDGAEISNTDSPCIYVKNADKVFVTTTDSENTLTVTGEFTDDGNTNTDAVIFSKDDLVLNGLGTLNISSTDNGITSRDELKITGGTYNITSAKDSFEANDQISIADGTFNVTSGKDAFHCENDEDNSVGHIYICGGSFYINAEDDGIQATSILQIDGGTFEITSGEGMEGTWVQINGGTINISASDDGVNASLKSSCYDVVFEMNDGSLTIVMGQGDTDAIDSNGSIYINGGTIDITAQFAFDFDQKAEHNGGTITVNGEQVSEITNSMMGGFGPMGGSFGGGWDMEGFPGGQDGDFGDGWDIEGFPGGQDGDFGDGWDMEGFPGGQDGGFGGGWNPGGYPGGQSGSSGGGWNPGGSSSGQGSGSGGQGSGFRGNWS